MQRVVGWKYFTTQKQWEAYLKDLLWYNDNTLLKSILMIYDRQTEEEKRQGASIDNNNVGFTKVDAKEMGRIARKIKNGQQLTYAEMGMARRKMQKYWKQLMELLEQSKQLQERMATDILKQEEEKERMESLQRELEEAQEKYKLKKQQFRESMEIMRKCAEEGFACDYGICDECPLTKGYQMHLDLSNKDVEY